MIDLFEYWQHQPPVHELVAGFFGIKPPTDSVDNEAAIAALQRQFPDGKIPADGRMA